MRLQPLPHRSRDALVHRSLPDLDDCRIVQRTMQLLRSLSTGTLHLVVVGENIERSPYYEYGKPSGKRSKRRSGK